MNAFRIKLQIVFFLLGFFTLQSFAQNDDRLFHNSIFHPDISTVILSKNMNAYDPIPIIGLNTNIQLKLMFDMLQPTNEFFTYTIIHCDANWKPSNLQQMEYLNGNPIGQIDDFKFSTNTYQTYVHYELIFPNEDMEITKSGNYILKVFKDFNEDDVYLTRRFMVLDSRVRIDAIANSATNADKRFTHHEIDFDVDHTGYQIPNPFTDVKAVILQNNSWTNAIYNLKPLFVNSNKLIFNYEKENLFPATNEFRFFDIRTLRFFSQNIIDKFHDTILNVVIRPDEPRYHLEYLLFLDYNGKRVIQNTDGANLAEDGDYVKAHLYFQSPPLEDHGDVFIFGELSDWQLKDDFKMTYEPDNGRYYANVKLKQSYYNYHYVVGKTGGTPDYTFTEGNFFQTENDYLILLYHKNIFLGYDELVGLSIKNTAIVRN